ncbi:MAG: UTP--glucose-1-phosphate uridylyltransferase GalU [Pseudomonadota bacterium]|nr:UTP--glucose-1-phosphate uridylyltransferase GalU [Pseudomonadota bacterium]
MGKKIKKAVFPVAGLGTRFLPVTKANPKEMLPVVDKPLVQYAAEEAVAAGIEVLIFVTGRNKRSIPDHFDKAYELESELEAKNKTEMLKVTREVLPPGVTCVYIRQSEALGLGHAVACAEPVIGDEAFAIILADDLIDDGKRGCIRQMVEVYEEYQCGVIGVEQVPREEVSSYGVVDGVAKGDRLWGIRGLVEKPAVEDAPSNIAVVGRYILEASIFDQLRQTNRGAGGEIQLTDAIAGQIQSGGSVMAYEFEGVRYDCGNKLGYLQANVELALKHPELKDEFREYIDSLKT